MRIFFMKSIVTVRRIIDTRDVKYCGSSFFLHITAVKCTQNRAVRIERFYLGRHPFCYLSSLCGALQRLFIKYGIYDNARMVPVPPHHPPKPPHCVLRRTECPVFIHHQNAHPVT